MSKLFSYADDRGNVNVPKVVMHIVAALLVTISSLAAGCPLYNVWEQGLVGQAALARAEQDRRIAVLEAQARLDSAKLNAQTEIERARGVAQANTIIGEGLEGHTEYLTYLWIMAMEHTAASANGSTVVYVPTEANLPVLEAGRLSSIRPPQ